MTLMGLWTKGYNQIQAPVDMKIQRNSQRTLYRPSRGRYRSKSWFKWTNMHPNPLNIINEHKRSWCNQKISLKSTKSLKVQKLTSSSYDDGCHRAYEANLPPTSWSTDCLSLGGTQATFTRKENGSNRRECSSPSRRRKKKKGREGEVVGALIQRFKFKPKRI